MNNETKNEVKKNVATGVSTATGATAGVIIGAAVTPSTAEAHKVITTEPEPQPTPAPHTPSPKPESEPQPKPEPIPQPNPEPPTPGPEPEPTDIEVLSYDRVTNEDGSQMDIAVLNVNGNEVGVIDVNLDGEADALVCDLNQNGVIEDGEMEIVQGQGIEMQPLADAAGFNPQFAQNDLPDYVNDADVDTYMA
ncbi:MAG: hypothetical protein J1E57_06635 [Prevotella sp.]|nr:hypothetical protein [Prevotella sp.]